MNPKLAQPLHLSGSGVGCLLIHGFTSTPTDVHPLSRHLHSCGYTVQELLLPGHGTSHLDMAGYGWRDWLQATEKGLEELKRKCSQVWLAGFSMGGILAAIAASRNHVHGLICISAPIWPRPQRAKYAWLLKYFQKYAQMGKRSELQFPSWRYEQVAVKNIADLMHLIRMGKAALVKVDIPALVVQGTEDRTIEPRSAEYIYRSLASSDKELFIVDNGGHMLLLESRSEEVCARVGEFLSIRTGGNRDA